MITQRTENDIPGGCMMAFIAVLLICGLIVIMGCTKSSVSPDYTPDGLTLIAQPPNQSPNLKSAAPNRMPNGGGDGAADWYDESNDVERNNPLLNAMAAQFGLSQAQVDAAFVMMAGL